MARTGIARLTGVFASAVLVMAGLSACTSDKSSGHGPAPAESGQSAKGFPRTVKTKFGNVTVDKKPKRIVALDPTTADELISLGVKPAAVAADPKQLGQLFPWMEGSIKNISHKDVYPNQRLDVEALAKLKPDLVVGAAYQFKDKDAFAQVSKIAPTVVPNSQDTNPDWDLRLKSTAAAVDKTSRADSLIKDIKHEYQSATKAVPGAKNATYNWVAYADNQFEYGNGSIFELAGLKPNKGQNNGMTGKPVSAENTDKLSADVLAIFPRNPADRKKIEKIPAYQNLPAVKAGTVYYASVAEADALNSPAPMALRWFEKKITPTIKKLK